MSAFWSAYITILSLGCLAFVVGAFWLANSINVHREPDNTTGHDYDGIREYDNPMPRWWKLLYIGGVLFFIFYVAAYPALGSYKGFLGWTSVGEHDKDQAAYDAKYGPIFKAYAQKPVEELAHDEAAMKIAGRLFANNCAACHGADARGAKGFPNLTDDDWLYGGSPEKIKETLLHGRLAVEGGLKMPAWKDVLGEQGIKEVTAYVLTLSDRKLSAEDQKLAEVGQAKFAACAACHGADGRGNYAVGAPNLTDAIWLYGGSKATIEETLRHGRNGAMPAWEKALGAEKVHLLTAYVYSLSHGGAKH
ncbi:cytochrome-c oxidase, cbb3-type subunit III [Agitococcus lubricus]|uniref:Cbb3-type cytochrome c oxidase subunit n=1 Tax=Agitococcus lubricus TaxID=1077255 RepID=A0A2T5IX32_9GAMM|nr:cytochrome-c oxidase, cbb3-type subunit III [Agitococcus lubricus]PTQ88502.1 cytochrome c oxidase cbb3-type subunit 3 [Agitococcus lubricus]